MNEKSTRHLADARFSILFYDSIIAHIDITFYYIISPLLRDSAFFSRIYNLFTNRLHNPLYFLCPVGYNRIRTGHKPRTKENTK